MARGGKRPGAGRKPGSTKPVPPKGAPTAYRVEFAKQAEKLCTLGATDVDLADFFGVSDRTRYRWAAKHEDFCQALKAGKQTADLRVERALYHRAVGYSFDSEKVFQFQGTIVRAPMREHVPPDTTAGIFWLKNRRKEDWRDKIDHEHTGTVQFERIERVIVDPANSDGADIPPSP